jgi:hypothetical protein
MHKGVGGGHFSIGISYWKFWMQNINGLLFTKKLIVICDAYKKTRNIFTSSVVKLVYNYAPYKTFH